MVRVKIIKSVINHRVSQINMRSEVEEAIMLGPFDSFFGRIGISSVILIVAQSAVVQFKRGMTAGSE